MRCLLLHRGQDCNCFFLLSKGTHLCVPGGGGAGLCPGMKPVCCGTPPAPTPAGCSVPGPLAIDDDDCGGGGGAGRCPAMGVILVGGGKAGGGTFGAGRDGDGREGCALTWCLCCCCCCCCCCCWYDDEDGGDGRGWCWYIWAELCLRRGEGCDGVGGGCLVGTITGGAPKFGTPIPLLPPPPLLLFPLPDTGDGGCG